ncbi:hypothetical protein FIBSPDRAFT_958232 [Athelia psychrophila]|uniref:Uncharacterized protein n=1 Tax=Athelia psychrophila TaxID=1759441 RepID=A0A166EX59_9AGAM|nr:hypothetical protein FIBSPDRAFT_958232 [Fibularhizoctonia sp. CBS 109695]
MPQHLPAPRQSHEAPSLQFLHPVRAIAIGDSSSFAQLLVGSRPARIVHESWAAEQPSSVQLLRPRQFFDRLKPPPDVASLSSLVVHSTLEWTPFMTWSP